MDGAQQSDERGYRVLARKYRPTSFDDLIGQDPMVRTLSNAFKAGRIAQAWMLTGVRGVGKTTTARILARALNYEIEGEIDRPTIDMPKLGAHCQAIMEGRHVDVIEMDAASHTGIGDIREIIEAARYKPVSARYKVYIIDEVHMLSGQAFNGLLKTLEEPPAHVKFVFATTEIRKVPVTVLSRCQRFDLRRIEADLLAQFLKKIADAESVGIEAEALAMIARAAEGSVRDSLSLLDQAIAHGAETVAGETVRSMLGLADRAKVTDLFERVMRGDIAAALDIVKQQYDIGAEPAVILSDLAEFTHLVTKFKISPDYDGGQAVTELERTRGQEFAAALSMRILARAWQILLKGVAEVQSAPRPLAAADMVLVRLCYAADLPTPDELARQAHPQPGGAPQPSATPDQPPQAMADAPAPSARTSAALAVSGTEPGSPSASPPAPSAQSAVEPVAYAGPNVVTGNFGQSGAAAQRKPEPLAEPEPEPIPAVEPDSPPAIEPQTAPSAAAVLSSLRDIADLLGEKRDLKLKFAVERQVRPIAMEPGKLEISIEPGAPADLASGLARFLEDQTGMRWMVAVSRETGGRTLHETERQQQQRLLSDAAAHPDVAAVLKAFPGAKIVDVRLSPRDEAPDETGLDDGGEDPLGEFDD